MGTFIELNKGSDGLVLQKACPGFDQKCIRIFADSLSEVYPTEWMGKHIVQRNEDGSDKISFFTPHDMYFFTWKDKNKGLILCEILRNGKEPVEKHYLVDSTKTTAFKMVKATNCQTYEN